MNEPVYFELSDSLNKRGNFFPRSSIAKFMNVDGEGYRSYFAYSEKTVQKIRSNKPLGKTDKLYLPSLVFDIDRGSDSFDDMINKARTFVDKLMSEYDLEDQFQIWTSGRGIHVHTPDFFGFEPSHDLPEIVRETIGMHFPEIDIAPINKRGLIRLPYTMNLKNSLYKVPIRENEIWFINESEYINYASKKRKIETVNPKDWKKYPELIIVPKKETFNTLKVSDSKPSRYVTCAIRMYQAGPVDGHRHERILRIASWLRLRGLPLTATLEVIKSYIGSEWSYEWVRVVNDVYRNEYEFSCEDKIMKEFCSPKCVFYKRKNWLTEIQSASEIEKNYIDFINDDWKSNSINMASILDLDADEWYVNPEDVIGLIGGTGLNKTALMQNIALKLKDFSPLLYISTEFSNNLVVRRFSQIEHEMTIEEIQKYYIDNTKNGEFKGKYLSEEFSHIKFVAATPTYEGLEDLIRKYKPTILMIDVVDDIVSQGRRGTDGESKVAQGLKDLGRKYKHITFYVHHISKSAAFDEKGVPKVLNIHSGKGSSTIEQKSDIVFGIEGFQQQSFRVLRTLKQRDNPPFQNGYDVNMNIFKFDRNHEKDDLEIRKKKAKLN